MSIHTIRQLVEWKCTKCPPKRAHIFQNFCRTNIKFCWLTDLYGTTIEWTYIKHIRVHIYIVHVLNRRIKNYHLARVFSRVVQKTHHYIIKKAKFTETSFSSQKRAKNMNLPTRNHTARSFQFSHGQAERNFN